jgi:DNA-binding Lrp family transcriptional regulator
MTETDRDRIENLPPSAKLVFKTLEYHGPLTQKDIGEESRLSERTVRYAIERLEENSIITEDIFFPDARQSLYEIDL